MILNYFHRFYLKLNVSNHSAYEWLSIFLTRDTSWWSAVRSNKSFIASIKKKKLWFKFSFKFSGGNQRDLARAKNQKKLQEAKRGARTDNLTVEQRKARFVSLSIALNTFFIYLWEFFGLFCRDADILREKQKKKEEAAAAAASGAKSSKWTTIYDHFRMINVNKKHFIHTFKNNIYSPKAIHFSIVICEQCVRKYIHWWY